MNLFPLSIALPLNTSLHSLYPFLSPDSSRNIIVWRTDNWQRYSSAKEETSLNLQEFYSVPLMWKFHHLFPGMLAMLHKHIKKEMERLHLHFCSLQISASKQKRQINFSSLEFDLEGKQHSDLICIWWLSFINGKAGSSCTELRLGLASVFMLHPRMGEELSTFICYLKGVTLKCVTVHWHENKASGRALWSFVVWDNSSSSICNLFNASLFPA